MKENNNFKKIAGILMILFVEVISYAQPQCGSNPAANDICSSATPICNLNGYCGNTSSSYTNYVSSSNHTSENNTPLGALFCASIQNNSWIKFIASASSAIFNVWVSNCAINKGIQMQIYSTTDCYNFTSVSNCWNPQTPTNGQITATGLIPGQIYYFMIDGANGDNCDYVIAASSGVTTAPVITPDQLICKGSSAAISITGGNSYTWSSSPTDASLAGQNTQENISVNPSVTTTYSVTVTTLGNNAFCTNNNNVLTTLVTVAPLPILSTTTTPEHCSLADGIATVSTIDDTTLYHYLWNSSPQQSTRIATHLAAGTYSVSVTDTNSCLSKTNAIVTNIPFLNPVITGNPSFCEGDSTILNVGDEYITYVWSNGSNTHTTQANSQGVYFVTVSMSVSCVGSDSFFVRENLSPIPIITGNPLICPQVPAFIDVGTGYTSYQWSTGDTIQAINITSENSYSVSVTDTNGCVGSTSMLVKNNNGPILTSNTQNEICGRANGSALINASGGLGIYSYLWSNGANLPLDSGLTQGIYSVSVSDGNCSVSSNVIVNETHGPIANFYVQPSPLVLFEKSVTANFYDCSTGSVVDWFWNFGDTTNTATGNQVIHDYYNIGYYPITLIVSDTNGCIDTLIRKILVRDYFTCYIPNCFTPSSNDEINNWFSPKGANWQSKDFEMYIFDRWGDMLFQSKDVTNTSWNGTFNNTGSPSDAVMGVYQYLIRIREDSNTLHEYIGSVTLLK